MAPKTGSGAGVSQAAPVPPVKTVDLKLFRNFANGMGDAEEVRFNHRMEDYAAIWQVTTKYNRVHGSIDARQPGQIRMGYNIKSYATVSHDLVPIFGVEWTDTNGVYPVIYYMVGRKLMKIAGSSGVGVAEVGTNSLGANNATTGMFDDDGSGIPYLYAGFGGATGSGFITRMNRAQAFTTSADVVAGLLMSLNGSAYRTIRPASGTADCQVSVCPYGADRMTASAWLAGTTVGFAGTAINVLTSVRQAAVAIKPEGIFVYNQGLDQWVNQTRSWINFQHANNGVGAFQLGDQLVVPLGDGGAVIFDGSNAHPFDPVSFDATPNLHTTRTRISAMSSMRNWVAGAVGTTNAGDGAAKLISAGNSLKFVYTVDELAYTDNSTSVRDLDLSTQATLPANAALHIYIGWTRPFTAFRFDTGAANSVVRTMTVSIGTTAPSTYSSIACTDFTTLAGATLGQSGDVVMTADPVAAGWVQTTVNGTTAYWVKLTFSGALTAAVAWLNCQIQPWYPSVDTTMFPLDGLDKSGCFPHILYGRAAANDPAGQWHDMVSLSSPDNIGIIIFSNIGGTGINRARNLIAIGRFRVWQLCTAADDQSSTETAPILSGVGLLEGPAQAPQPGSLVRLKSIKIMGHDFDPAWTCCFYYTWDAGKSWSKMGKALRVPIEYEFTDQSNYGYRFRWAIGWSGTAGEALSQPTITEIIATFEVLDIPINTTQERAVRTQPVI